MNEGANYLGQVIKEMAISVAIEKDRAARAEAEVMALKAKYEPPVEKPDLKVVE